MQEVNGRIKVVIADDESHGRESIKICLTEHTSIELVGEARNGEEAVPMILALKPDLLFLDIQMPGLNGLEVIQHIKDYCHPVIIFTTAYDQYALQAFDANAVDYLLKPFDEHRFESALNKALLIIDKKNQSELFGKLVSIYNGSLSKGSSDFIYRILIKETKRVFFIKVEDVYWFEASGDYVILHTETKSHLVSYRLHELEEKLNPDKFVRIHRSTIINVDFIQEFEPHFNGEYFITLQNKTRLKMSRTFRDGLKTHFADLFEP